MSTTYAEVLAYNRRAVAAWPKWLKHAKATIDTGRPPQSMLVGTFLHQKDRRAGKK